MATIASVLKRLEAEEERRKAGDAAALARCEELEGRIKALEAKPAPQPSPVEPPPPPPAESPKSSFAPDIFYGDSFAKFPQKNGQALWQPTSPSDAVTQVTAGFELKGCWRLRVDDNTGLNITSNPRAEMLSAPIPNNQEIWWGLAWELPAGFPTSIPGWWNLAEYYGEPWAGSPTIEIDLRGNGVGWHTNSEGGNKDIWRAPYKPGTKETALIHIQPYRVEMWHNNGPMPICSIDLKTVGAANSKGPQHCYIQNYRQRGMFPQAIDIYHWPLAVGTKRELVEYHL